MATLEQQIQAKIDELNALKEKQRKKDNQQKIIIGALVLKECGNNPAFASQLLGIINKASDRDKKKLETLATELAKTAKQPPAPTQAPPPQPAPTPETAPRIELDPMFKSMFP